MIEFLMLIGAVLERRLRHAPHSEALQVYRLFRAGVRCIPDPDGGILLHVAD